MSKILGSDWIPKRNQSENVILIRFLHRNCHQISSLGHLEDGPERAQGATFNITTRHMAFRKQETDNRWAADLIT